MRRSTRRTRPRNLAWPHSVITITSRDEIVVGDARKWMLRYRPRSTQPTPFTGQIAGIPVESITTGIDEAFVLTRCDSVCRTSLSTSDSRVRFHSPLHCAAWTYSKSIGRNVNCRPQASKRNVLCIVFALPWFRISWLSRRTWSILTVDCVFYLRYC